MLDRAELFTRVPADVLGRLERPEFHLVVVGRSGSGRHEVDLVSVDIEPGTVVHIQPGQIHRWDVDAAYDAWLGVFPEAPVHPEGVAVGVRRRSVTEEAVTRIASLADWLATPGVVDTALARRSIRDLFYVTAGLAEPVDRDSPARDPVYEAFRHDLEASLDARETVTARAARLGCSPRTLNRACLRVTGATAKQKLDQRLALEVRRKLAVPGATVGAVARELGFTEPSNFTKFVRRTTGAPPSRWRSGS